MSSLPEQPSPPPVRGGDHGTDGPPELLEIPEAESSPPVILYVDDDDLTRRTGTCLLRQAGFQTREASSGMEALSLASLGPDLIILDVNLPDLNGIEVCRRIKTDPATAAIPVLHVSGVRVASQDRTEGLESGADLYLVKPVEPEELLATVRASLRSHHGEEASRLAIRHWAATFDAIRDGVWLVDRTDKVRRWNQALSRLLDRRPAEILDRPFPEVLVEAFGRDAGPLLALLAQEAVGPEEEILVGQRWLQVSVAPVLEMDQVVGRVHVLADITRRKTAEEQLRQSQKMEAVGRLASGIAHDFNNLLTAITGNLSLLLARTPKDDGRRELLELTEQVSWHAADLTRQLLAFARKSHLQLNPTDLRACIEDTVRILRRTFHPNIALRVDTPPGLWRVHADPVQISQVLMNLCLNARDAMPEGGEILLSAENLTVPEGPAAADGRRPGPFVRVAIRDTGSGIPQEVQAQVFDPFFSTKEIGRGTGLGLALVYGILQQHLGWVECESIPGQGSTFHFFLPRSEAADDEPG